MPTGLDWVCPLCGLTGQHYTVGAVEHSVSYIADFRPRRSRIVLSAIRMNTNRLGNMFGLLTVIDYRAAGQYGMDFAKELRTSNI
jgi:hypothetical protein